MQSKKSTQFVFILKPNDFYLPFYNKIKREMHGLIFKPKKDKKKKSTCGTIPFFRAWQIFSTVNEMRRHSSSLWNQKLLIVPESEIVELKSYINRYYHPFSWRT